ncbi:MAG: DinB family protein [Anaerolineales bacterium]
MKATQKEIDQILRSLAETPLRIVDSVRGMDDSRLQAKSDRKSWSANDILAHLRSCADVWGNSIEAMLAEDTPTLPDVHPRKWVKETNYLKLPFHESFQAFVKQREKLLITLKKLSFDAWSRAALIGGRRHTVFTQARRMAKHENEHCEQIVNLRQGAP